MLEQHSVVVTPHTCRSMEKADMEVFVEVLSPHFIHLKFSPPPGLCLDSPFQRAQRKERCWIPQARKEAL